MPSFKNINKSLNSRFTELDGSEVYDLYVQGVFTPNFEGLLSFSTGSPSAKIAGLIKLSQQFLINLMTTPGSDILEPNRGTELANLVGNNFWNFEELKIIIGESVKSAAKQTFEQQQAGQPKTSDEMLQSAEITKLEYINNDEVHPHILITSDSGRLAKVKLPGFKASQNSITS